MAYTIIKLASLNNSGQTKNNSLDSSTPDLDGVTTQPPSIGFPDSNGTRPNGGFSPALLGSNDRFFTQDIINDTTQDIINDTIPIYPPANTTIDNTTNPITNTTIDNTTNPITNPTVPEPLSGPAIWIVTAASGALVFVVIVVFCCVCCRKKKNGTPGGAGDGDSVIANARPTADYFFDRTANKYGKSDSFLPVVTRKQVIKKPYHGAVRLVKTGFHHKA
jgi:hypothetical protein